MTPHEALEKAIAVLGSQTAVAAAAGSEIKTGHVYYWLKAERGVPAPHCPGIQRATSEKGNTVFCEELCPGVDWATVRATAGPEQQEQAA